MQYISNWNKKMYLYLPLFELIYSLIQIIFNVTIFQYEKLNLFFPRIVMFNKNMFSQK